MALQFVTSQIKDLAVSNGKIANNAVNASKMDLTASYNFTSGTLTVGTPSADSEVANKAYVDAIAQGLHWKDSVACVAAGNITLSGTQTIDGISAGVGDRVLVKGQTAGAANGIYVVAAGAWSRSTDMDAAAEFPGAAMFVRAGTANADSGWVCTNDTVNVGVTSVTFAQFSGAGQIVAGAGLAKSGNTLSVNVDGSSLEIDGDNLRVKASGITSAMILDGTVVNADINASAAIAYSKLSLNNSITNADLAGSIAYGKLVLGGAILNTDLAGSIANSKLANDGITIAGTDTSLGGSITAATILNVDMGGDFVIGTQSDDVAVFTGKIKVTANAILDSANNPAITLDGAGNIATSSIQLNGNAIKASTGVTALTLSGANVTVAGDLTITGDDITMTTNTSGHMLVADGTNYNPVAISGDVAMASSGAVTIQQNAVDTQMLSWRPRYQEFSGDGVATVFNLGFRILDANWRVATVFRNGQALTQLASGADDVDEFQVADTGAATQVTFGAAPESGDVLYVTYLA